MRISFGAALAGALASAVLPATTLAYNFIDYCNGSPVGWSSASASITGAQASFPAGGSWYNSLLTAIRRVNDNPSRFYYTLYTGDTSVAIGNGQSEIWFSSSADFNPAVAYNQTVCYWSGSQWVYYIDETDIVFYNVVPYTTNLTTSNNLRGYGGLNRPFETTAIHELGHGSGLAHVNTEYNIMGTDYYHLHANGGLARSYLGEDASDGEVRLYGLANTIIEDVSLVHWKRIGASGEYSSHGRTALYDSSGATVLPSVLDAGEARFDVNAGQVIQMELTAENNGRSSHTPRIGYYLSTNNVIATSDTLIATETRGVTRNNVDTYKAVLTIPSGLPAGNYWLGAIIDDTNALAERVEDNNATYFPVRYLGGGTTTAPTANFSYATSGLTVSFSDSSTDSNGTIASRLWTFGDGTSSSDVNPVKTYGSAGTYNVTLAVTDNDGETGSRSQSVAVAPPPTLPECTFSDTRQLGRNCQRSGRSASAGKYDYMYINLPSGVSQLRVRTSGGTGNVSLYYNSTTWATSANAQYSSTGPTNDETLTIANPPSGYVYISLYGVTAASGVVVTTQY